MKTVLAALIAYLLGSLNFSLIFSYLLFGKDVRKSGSGNAGATNMARTFGALPGILTLAGDAAKTLAALFIGKSLGGSIGILISGVFCLIGHCFPVLFRFQGGKGVAVGTAILFFCSWKVGLCAVAVFFVVACVSKKVSLGSVLGALGALAAALVLKMGAEKLALVVFACFVVLLMHLDNIQRLMNGTEPDFHFRKHVSGGK